MNFPLLFRTARHLRSTQIVHQLINRLRKPGFQFLNTTKHRGKPCFRVRPVEKYVSLTQGNHFCFLNLEKEFEKWNDKEFGMLWAYNLNYMDWLLQPGMTFEEGKTWIDRFSETLLKESKNVSIGLDPYPTALRCINWIKFISIHHESVSEEQRKHWDDVLYSQVKLLEKKLEYHLLGNHLLEDAYALFIAATYFCDNDLLHMATRLLLEELKEQILPDGAHYEQSPMYHCILLDRLLDCCNAEKSIHGETSETSKALTEYAKRMLGHLQAMVYSDGTIPLFGDSALNIAPTPQQIFEYAKALSIAWSTIPMKECGYRRFVNEHFEMTFDAGNITATYQPGHTHADTFTLDLRIDGKPFLTDTGISTYDKTTRRQYERGTTAHNTVSIDGNNSSEVWGGFRVGHRARVFLKEDGACKVSARHNGYAPVIHQREVALNDNVLTITDNLDNATKAKATAHFHLALQVKIERLEKNRLITSHGILEWEGQNVEATLRDDTISVTYNRFVPTKVLNILFSQHLVCRIKANT